MWVCCSPRARLPIVVWVSTRHHLVGTVRRHFVFVGHHLAWELYLRSSVNARCPHPQAIHRPLGHDSLSWLTAGSPPSTFATISFRLNDISASASSDIIVVRPNSHRAGAFSIKVTTCSSQPEVSLQFMDTAANQGCLICTPGSPGDAFLTQLARGARARSDAKKAKQLCPMALTPTDVARRLSYDPRTSPSIELNARHRQSGWG